MIESRYHTSNFLQESELWRIFKEICEAVEYCHRQSPPISHRDLKVENVLVNDRGEYRLCDFGSATTTNYHPSDERSRNIALNDIEKNTTMSYRAPEMIDLYRGQPINEKADICIFFYIFKIFQFL
jgi:AP2-associated kinase